MHSEVNILHIFDPLVLDQRCIVYTLSIFYYCAYMYVDP
jgi:hypothetical protein